MTLREFLIKSKVHINAKLVGLVSFKEGNVTTDEFEQCEYLNIIGFGYKYDDGYIVNPAATIDDELVTILFLCRNFYGNNVLRFDLNQEIKIGTFGIICKSDDLIYKSLIEFFATIRIDGLL